MNADFTPEEAARALGGRVVGKNRVRAPSPGMPPTDESLEIKFDHKYTEGWTVNDYYGGGENWKSNRDFVREKVGKPWKPHHPKDNPAERMNARASKDFSGAKPQPEEPAKKDKPKLGPIVKTYDYTEANGTLIYQITRHDPKDFRQRKPDGKGGWINESSDRHVPYRWPDLVAYPDATAFVCEGEKDADRLASLELTATTVDGRGTWSAECLEALRGRHIVVLEDNDEKGRKRAGKAAKVLHSQAASLRYVRFPELKEAGDVSDWLDVNNNDIKTLVDRCLTTPEWVPPDENAEKADGAEDFAQETVIDELPPMTLLEWRDRELPTVDRLLGYWLTTTTRGLLTADTGLGKTNLGLAFAMRIAAGVGFLHWQGHRPCRVLYIDGEMSRPLLQQRLHDEAARLGQMPKGFFALSREDVPKMQPFNTTQGQAWVDALIKKIGGVDLIIFDNIMSLTTGNPKDPEPWQQTLPWVLTLTTRRIGQIWIHHTGHDATRSYGDKSREWQMDTTMHLDAAKRADTDVSFSMKFNKARERTPTTRHDFQEVTIALVNDRWEHSLGAASKPVKVEPMVAKALDALTNVIGSAQAVTLTGSRRAATTKDWKKECELLGLLDPEAKANTYRALFSKFRRDLVAANRIACEGDHSWLLR